MGLAAAVTTTPIDKVALSGATQIWNCGGGTRSAAIAALIVSGWLPKPDFAILAEAELNCRSVRDYVGAYIAPALAAVGISLQQVRGRSLGESGFFHTRTAPSDAVSTTWLDYSIDELGHAIDAHTSSAVPGGRAVRFPLIELGMKTTDCLAILKRMGWPVPRSASQYLVERGSHGHSIR